MARKPPTPNLQPNRRTLAELLKDSNQAIEESVTLLCRVSERLNPPRPERHLQCKALQKSNSGTTES